MTNEMMSGRRRVGRMSLYLANVMLGAALVGPVVLLWWFIFLAGMIEGGIAQAGVLLGEFALALQDPTGVVWIRDLWITFGLLWTIFCCIFRPPSNFDQ